MKDISIVIEYVGDMIDRGYINCVKDGLREFLKDGGKVDVCLVERCLEEEFEEGWSDNWDGVEWLN